MLGARDDVQLAALCDPNAARLEAASQLLGGQAHPYQNAGEMLRGENLDGVVITSPDYLHAKLCVQVLRAGVRHILVDKPLATTVEGCLQVAQAARESGGSVSVGFNLRHHALMRAIKEMIAGGEVGELMLLENREFYDGGRTYHARWNRFYALSGGLWVHKGSHDFDVFNWWNQGGTPERVTASAGLNAMRPDKLPFPVQEGTPVGPACGVCAYQEVCPDFSTPFAGRELFNARTQQEDGYAPDECVFLSEKDTHDNGIALVEYSNNVRASHLECFVCGFTDRLFSIVGTRATLMARLSDPSRIELWPRWGEMRLVPVSSSTQSLQQGHGGADPLLVQEFARSLHGQASQGATIQDGLRAVAVGQAAELAWRQKRSVELRELVDLDTLQGGHKYLGASSV